MSQEMASSVRFLPFALSVKDSSHFPGQLQGRNRLDEYFCRGIQDFLVVEQFRAITAHENNLHIGSKLFDFRICLLAAHPRHDHIHDNQRNRLQVLLEFFNGIYPIVGEYHLIAEFSEDRLRYLTN